jgi:hypothetical protein
MALVQTLTVHGLPWRQVYRVLGKGKTIWTTLEISTARNIASFRGLAASIKDRGAGVQVVDMARGPKGEHDGEERGLSPSLIGKVKAHGRTERVGDHFKCY